MNIAIIGYGRIGAEHAHWISQTDNARVSAVFDPTPARREIARGRGLRAVDELQQALDSADAVLVSSPTSMHFDEALAALRAGKHVMVEKPMALDYPQSLQLVEEAERRKLTLSVFHNRRWDIDYLTVKSAIQSGFFGKIINVESRLHQWSSCIGPAARQWHPEWRTEAIYGGGGLYDWGSHFIDQLWQLMLPARPLRVFAQLRGNVWSRDCDDFARVCIDFDNGAVALLEINTTTTRPLPRWHIDGTEGSADSASSLEFDTHVWAQLHRSTPDSFTSQMPLAAPGFTEVQIWQAFAQRKPVVDPRSVLITMKLLDAARRSSATGQAISIV